MGKLQQNESRNRKAEKYMTSEGNLIIRPTQQSCNGTITLMLVYSSIIIKMLSRYVLKAQKEWRKKALEFHFRFKAFPLSML